jgi:uncharacterized protein (DUF433 family)
MNIKYASDCPTLIEVNTMRREQVINWDPDILGGTPVFAGTRVPVQTLIDYLKNEEQRIASRSGGRI